MVFRLQIMEDVGLGGSFYEQVGGFFVGFGLLPRGSVGLQQKNMHNKQGIRHE